MKTILTIASSIGSVLLLTISGYAYSNESGHSGADPWLALFIFVPLLLLGAVTARKSETAKYAIVAIGIAISGIALTIYLNRTNTLLEYDTWIERGMPQKGKGA